MSVNTNLNVDSAAVANNATLLPLVQAVYAPANTAYVYTGAARVGISRLSDSQYHYTVADYALQAGVLTAITLAAEDDDDAAAQVIATALGISKARVLSKAVCTGLTLLVGTDAEPGPFT